MKNYQKIITILIIIILFIQLVIGTPFTNSIADEIIDNSVTILETLEPTNNTI